MLGAGTEIPVGGGAGGSGGGGGDNYNLHFTAGPNRPITNCRTSRLASPVGPLGVLTK